MFTRKLRNKDSSDGEELRVGAVVRGLRVLADARGLRVLGDTRALRVLADARGLRVLAVAVAAGVAIAGCGSSTKQGSPSTAATVPPSAGAQLAVGSNARAAEHPSAQQFPRTQGRTLEQMANLAKFSVQLGAATGTYTPGTRRFAFALNESSGAFLYAPTALYLAPTPSSPAIGPLLAPADPMAVAPQYRSKQNSGPGGIEAIYETAVPLPHPGTYDVLALTADRSGLVGSTGEIAVAASSPIPDVGQRPPSIATDTLASTHGNVALLTTRVPPESMHSASFDQVLGKRPVALLFSTPQLCTSRVCGPVTDIAVSLQPQYQSQVVFLHQEVYANNQPSDGLRAQMKAFHLETEPWLFAVNRRGIIAARLEGAFGVNAMRQALQAAMH